MTPAIALTYPCERLAAIQPVEIIVDIDPRAIVLDENRLDCASARIAQHDDVRILPSIELLQDDFVGARGPAHSSDVVVARITRHGEPGGRTAVRRYDAYTRGGILGA